MTRTAALLACLSAFPAIAQSDPTFEEIQLQASQDALQNLQNYTNTVPQGTVLTADLNATGTYVVELPNDARLTHAADFVATYDKSVGLCMWSTDTDWFPLMPRTAAERIIIRAASETWPHDAVLPTPSTSGWCGARSALAQTAEGVGVIMPSVSDTFIHYFALRDTGEL